MSEIRPNVVPAVYIVLCRNKQVLLLLRQNTNYFDGYYALPAGHVKAGESPIQAVIREAYEEVGVIVKGCSLVHTMYRANADPTGDRLDLFFEAYHWVGEPVNAEPEKSKEIMWFPIKDLPKNLVPYQEEFFKLIERETLYSEIGF